MKPITQTILTAPGGNCFPACLASILELDLVKVPNFQGTDWQLQYYEWLRPLGLAMLTTAIPAGDQLERFADVVLPGYTILAVDSPRFAPLLHAVVALDGEVVWDPHPAAVAAEYPALVWREVSYLVVLDAGKFMHGAGSITRNGGEAEASKRHA